MASAVAAFLATATAVAAAFFAIPSTPPASDLVLPFASPSKMASTFVVDQRAVAVWHGVDGTAHIGAIDLSTGARSWPSLDLGTFADSLFPLGVNDGVMIVVGINDPSDAHDYTVLGVDVTSGKVRWQRPPQKHSVPLFALQAITDQGNSRGPGILVFRDNDTVSGVDWSTGRTVWTQSSTPDTDYAAPRDGRLVQIRSGGVLRILDVSTGRVTSERSGLPGVTHLNLILLDDWSYLADSGGVRRIPITGTQPASQLTGDYAMRVLHCGPHVCVYGTDFVGAFDPATGKELWRKEIKPHNPSRSSMSRSSMPASSRPSRAPGRRTNSETGPMTTR